MVSRQVIADLWRRSAEITRADIFSPADPLRPIYSSRGTPAAQVDVPAVGMVGRHYTRGGVVLLSVNPAGGKENFTSDPTSDQVYEAFRTLRDVGAGHDSLSALESVGRAVTASMPNWGITRQHTNAILDALGKQVEDVAYLYVVPFRTAGDAGSRMAKAYYDAGYRLHLEPQLNLLCPGLIVCVDRPSEAAAIRWVEEGAKAADCKVFYYTRKRDAHAERRERLAELREYRGGR